MNGPIHNLIDYLNYRRECGDRTVELEPETVKALRGMARKPSSGRSQAAVGTAASTEPPAPSPSPLAGGAAGNPAVAFMFVGEREGIDADRGKYSETFRKMVASMGFAPGEVAVTNICAGRKSDGPPSAAELEAAMPKFRQLVAAKSPKAIVIFGAVAAKALLGNGDIPAIHGKVFDWNGVKAIPTYHPAYMEKIGRAVKEDVCRDFCRAMEAIGKPIPAIYGRYK